MHGSHRTVWIGCSDAAVEGEWVWPDGSSCTLGDAEYVESMTHPQFVLLFNPRVSERNPTGTLLLTEADAPIRGPLVLVLVSPTPPC